MNYGSKQNMKKCEMEDPRTKNVIDKIYTATSCILGHSVLKYQSNLI